MNSKVGAVKQVRGFVWPAHDTHCAEVVFDSIPDLERAIDFTRKEHRTAIQAGGNCGVWAKHLAGVFKQVWTWEPDPLNYHCLARNTIAHRNVFCVNAGLGSAPGLASMHREEGNCGAHSIVREERPEGIPIEVIDDYDPKVLGIVDLIYLDVEGYELHALVGATQLIARDRPIIAVEDKGLSERYGVAKGDVIRYIVDTFNYEVCDQYARDFVLRPRA